MPTTPCPQSASRPGRRVGPRAARCLDVCEHRAMVGDTAGWLCDERCRTLRRPSCGSVGARQGCPPFRRRFAALTRASRSRFQRLSERPTNSLPGRTQDPGVGNACRLCHWKDLHREYWGWASDRLRDHLTIVRVRKSCEEHGSSPENRSDDFVWQQGRLQSRLALAAAKLSRL